MTVSKINNEKRNYSYVEVILKDGRHCVENCEWKATFFG